LENTGYSLQKSEMVSIVYTNYRGETAVRQIIPIKIWFGKTDWHPEEQWLLDAYDLEKGADRSFAMKDIRSWFTAR
jgi:predicted DNA-binding transcriptional regulator YafY